MSDKGTKSQSQLTSIGMGILVGLGATLAVAGTWPKSPGPARMGKEQFERQYRRLARQMLKAELESGAASIVRQLPCEAAYRRRYPERARAGGTLALKVDVTPERARIVDVGVTGGSLDEAMVRCLARAWPWLEKTFDPGPNVTEALFWTPFDVSLALRPTYPELPGGWEDPARWAEGFPAAWGRLVQERQQAAGLDLTASAAGVSFKETLSIPAFIEAFPILADELYDDVFSAEADRQRTIAPCLTTFDGHGLRSDLLVQVSVLEGKARLRPLLSIGESGEGESAKVALRLARCLFSAIGLRETAYAVPGAADADFIVRWPLPGNDTADGGLLDGIDTNGHGDVSGTNSKVR